MKKQIAIAALGGTVGKAANAVGISSQAVTQWPEDLPANISDRVIAGIVRGSPRLTKSVSQILAAAGSCKT